MQERIEALEAKYRLLHQVQLANQEEVAWLRECFKSLADLVAALERRLERLDHGSTE